MEFLLDGPPAYSRFDLADDEPEAPPPSYSRGVAQPAYFKAEEPPPTYRRDVLGPLAESLAEKSAFDAFDLQNFPRRFPLNSRACEGVTAKDYQIFFLDGTRAEWLVTKDYGNLVKFADAGYVHPDGKPLSVCSQFLRWIGRNPEETYLIDAWQDNPNRLTFFRVADEERFRDRRSVGFAFNDERGKSPFASYDAPRNAPPDFARPAYRPPAASGAVYDPYRGRYSRVEKAPGFLLQAPVFGR